MNKTNFDTLIIGGGIFGQVIAANLRTIGVDVAIVDAKFDGAGSKPAACLMKPSWFSSIGKENYKPALETLHRLYAVEKIEFKTGPVRHEVLWINPKEILDPATSQPVIEAAVVEVAVHMVNDHKQFTLTLHDGRQLTSRFLVCASGVWSNNFVRSKVPGLTGKTGVAFLWTEEKIEQPFISPWAPFKQIVGFNRGDGLWVGDGTAILEKNWTDAREEQSQRRCAKAVDLTLKKPKSLVGRRPYAQTADPCYLEEHGGMWVATGGAKNGTIAAGWAADRIMKQMR